jgi:hypothetical protein
MREAVREPGFAGMISGLFMPMSAIQATVAGILVWTPQPRNARRLKKPAERLTCRSILNDTELQQ